MQDRLLILAHVLTTLAKLLGPGGAEAMVADSLLLRCTVTRGKGIAAVCSNSRLQLELQFALHTVGRSS
jgi:hypothetical protein